MPGETGATVVTTLVCFFHFAHEAAGALVHPAFPTPSSGEGYLDNSGAARRGDAGLCLDVIARSDSDEAIHASSLPSSGLLRFARNDGYWTCRGCLKS
jgi:hypothetical protein